MSVRKPSTCQFDRRSPDSETFKDLRWIIHFSQTFKALNLADQFPQTSNDRGNVANSTVTSLRVAGGGWQTTVNILNIVQLWDVKNPSTNSFCIRDYIMFQLYKRPTACSYLWTLSKIKASVEKRLKTTFPSPHPLRSPHSISLSLVFN